MIVMYADKKYLLEWVFSPIQSIHPPSPPTSFLHHCESKYAVQLSVITQTGPSVNKV